MKCKNCGSEITDGMKFCTNCGCKVTNEKKFCENCGSEMVDGAKFCMKCGNSVLTDGEQIQIQQKQNHPKSKKKPILVGIVIAVMVVAVILVVVSNNTHKRPSGTYAGILDEDYCTLEFLSGDRVVIEDLDFDERYTFSYEWEGSGGYIQGGEIYFSYDRESDALYVTYDGVMKTFTKED